MTTTPNPVLGSLPWDLDGLTVQQLKRVIVGLYFDGERNAAIARYVAQEEATFRAEIEALLNTIDRGNLHAVHALATAARHQLEALRELAAPPKSDVRDFGAPEDGQPGFLMAIGAPGWAALPENPSKPHICPKRASPARKPERACCRRRRAGGGHE